MPGGTMKVIQFHQFGGPEVLKFENAPRPQPGPGEVLVRVHAVGLNPPDWYLRDGYKAHPEWRPPVTFPVIPGSDISGRIDAFGDDVDDLAVGDDVFGMIRFPSFGISAAYAEFVAAPATDVALKPLGISHVDAAGAAMSGLTAWQFLIDVGHDAPNPLQTEQHRPVPLDGRTVLINGAAGGVGHIAMQLAKWCGARVIAVASGRHQQFLRDLGADEFIDYSQTSAEDAVRDVDVVLDTIGGPSTSRFLRAIRPGGSLFPVFPGFSDYAQAADRNVTVSMTQVRSNGRQLAELGRLLEDGTVRIGIDSVFPLADARRSHERAAEGHIQGKIAMTVA